MQIKTTIKYHLTPTRMVKISKTDNKNVGKDAKQLNFSYTNYESENCITNLENTLAVSYKTKKEP